MSGSRLDSSSRLPPSQGALKLCPTCTTVLGSPEDFPGTECRKEGRKVSLSHQPSPHPACSDLGCLLSPSRGRAWKDLSSRARCPPGEWGVPGPCLPLMAPSPAESWPSCLSTCNGPAMGAYGPWRCGGRRYPMERPPVTRPLLPATGRAAPPSALGKGRGPTGPPPPLASLPPLPFFVSPSLRPACGHHVGVWACSGDSQALSRGRGICRRMA